MSGFALPTRDDDVCPASERRGEDAGDSLGKASKPVAVRVKQPSEGVELWPLKDTLDLHGDLTGDKFLSDVMKSRLLS